jgi:predicted nucleic acid-binding protein
MFLDTSVIIEVLTHGKDHRRIFRQILEQVETSAGDSTDFEYISMVQLAEISDWCAKNDILVKDVIESVKELAQIVVPLDEAISELSGFIKFEKRQKGFGDFGLIDAIILASARSVDQKLLTFDTHFLGESDCVVLASSRKPRKT